MFAMLQHYIMSINRGVAWRWSGNSAVNSFQSIFKVNGYAHLLEKQLCNFASFFNKGQLLKERICSSMSKFFSLFFPPLGANSFLYDWFPV